MCNNKKTNIPHQIQPIASKDILNHQWKNHLPRYRNICRKYQEAMEKLIQEAIPSLVLATLIYINQYETKSG